MGIRNLFPSAVLADSIGIIGHKGRPAIASGARSGNSVAPLHGVARGNGQGIRSIQFMLSGTKIQHTLQHGSHLFLACIAIAHYALLYFTRTVLVHHQAMAQGSGNTYTLGAAQFKHTLHIFPEKRLFNSGFIRPVVEYKLIDSRKNIRQARHRVANGAHIFYTQLNEAHFTAAAAQQAVAHHCHTRVNTQYYFFLFIGHL